MSANDIICTYDHVASFLALPPSSFLSLTVMSMPKMEGGAESIYLVSDINVRLSRQRGGEVPDQKSAFCACVLCPEIKKAKFSLCEYLQLQHLDRPARK